MAAGKKRGKMTSTAHPVRKQKVPPKSKAAAVESGRKNRNFPKHTLESVLPLAQKIQDEMGGKPMNRLLLADALGMSPSSSNYRELLSSGYKYGLTDGTEKADTISLTDEGAAATQQADVTARLRALRGAALAPSVFGSVLRDYANKKLPSPEMLPKILKAQYGVPDELAAECGQHLAANGKFVDVVREIGGSPHVLLDAELSAPERSGQIVGPEPGDEPSTPAPAPVPLVAAPISPKGVQVPVAGPRPIFLGHGKNKGPLQQLQTLLTTFRIPHKVVVDEANLGRPISQKVKDTIDECGSAILIFTRDEKLFDEAGKEVWRPSENVGHELGATSYAYGDRIVIFKERGLHFPTNYQSIGYIEFESGDLTARTADLLKELIGFGLVKVTPTQ
jgi:predicted nucleotide-binding protein with TIR-like domain